MSDRDLTAIATHDGQSDPRDSEPDETPETRCVDCGEPLDADGYCTVPDCLLSWDRRADPLNRARLTAEFRDYWEKHRRPDGAS